MQKHSQCTVGTLNSDTPYIKSVFKLVELDLAAQDEVKLQTSVDQIKTLSADIQAKYQKLDQLTEQESSAKLKVIKY